MFKAIFNFFFKFICEISWEEKKVAYAICLILIEVRIHSSTARSERIVNNHVRGNIFHTKLGWYEAHGYKQNAAL